MLYEFCQSVGRYGASIPVSISIFVYASMCVGRRNARRQRNESAHLNSVGNLIPSTIAYPGPTIAGRRAGGLGVLTSSNGEFERP